MRQEESRAIAIPYIGGKNVMPITGYFGPYPHEHQYLPDYFSDEVFKLIADSGINLMVYSCADYEKEPELVEKNLEHGEKYGVGVFVTDNSIVESKDQVALTKEKVEKQMKKYSEKKAFCGMYIVDEPTAPYFCEDISRLIPKYEKVSRLLQQDLDVLCYLNLLPVEGVWPDCKANYERYVDEFCDTLKPKVVMWDMYPFDKRREGMMEVYFWNMNVIREAAKKRNLPFWAFVQAGSQWNDNWDRFDSELPYYPSKAQFDWNVNTSLAMGAQGIQYFPLIQPVQFTMTTSEEGDYERNGIIGGMCNKTQWYEYAQTINKHIVAIDEVLMNSVNKGVIASGEQTKQDLSMTSCVIADGSFEQLRKVSGDALIGCFNYQGKTALYVVNYSYENAQDVVLTFEDMQNVKMIQNAQEFELTTDMLTLHMAAGEGLLIVHQ